ncbi:TPA: hypothetical protein EYP83_03120 [Candidatus Geothermarchaeota archaeon]|nr:hypothetical protein [Candidatus Geothermarchaeota archaeon]
MDRFYIIYLYISRRGGYAYSIVIENHYGLVIDLWCRYVGHIGYRETLKKAIVDSLREVFKMGLSDDPIILMVKDSKSAREYIDSNDFKELIKPFREIKVSLTSRWRYKRCIDLVRFCIDNRLERYPPSKLL